MLELLKNLAKSEYVLDETETLVKNVIDNLLTKDGTIAMVAPISETYYLFNEKFHYYIKTDGYSIVITNHKFTFKEGMSVKFGEMVVSTIKKYMEKNRTEFDKRVFDNQIELLKNINKTLEV
jgi:hypothetical protein